VVRRAGLDEAQDPTATPGVRFQFGLSSILLFVTLFAILCSIIKMSPGLGVALAILAAPALVRTCVVALRQSARGKSMSAGDKTAFFLVSVCMVLFVVVAAAGAFFVAAGVICVSTVPVGAASGIPSLAVAFGIAGIVVGFAAAAFVAWRLWKSLTRKHR
jgi:hypothetical protein